MAHPHQREVAIFEAAVQLPPEQREAYLERTCANDLALLQRIRALLLAHESQTDFLTAPAEQPILGAALPASEKLGDRVGPYKLLQQIGEGGCGVVYMAEQYKPVQRCVALKVIKLGMDTKQVIVRFEAERQALAMMDHPNIAKVLEAGATDTGRPYFVMELVRGVKITEYCDDNNLSTGERLVLFIQVCNAIQHAHQKGIIHRDIKPSNILVTLHDGVPVPKVIDFGIAKATQGRLTDLTLFTAFEQFIGTPAYMSPEQAEMSGLDIDTRSDIYGLGVLLYELITGETPFDAKQLMAAGLDAMRRTIREKEPHKPSTKLSTMAEAELTSTAKRRHTQIPKLLSAVRGDLDWIVMKCLEKNRARRYETANGLAVDLQRHLDNEPVVACPPSRIYRLHKMVRRNRGAFVAGAVILTLLVAGVGVSTWEAVRARWAEGKARSEAGKSEQIAQFLARMLEGVGPSVALGRDTTVLREILDKAAASIGSELTNNPDAEESLRYTLAKVYAELGHLREAEEMQRQALAIAKKTYGNEDPETGCMVEALADILIGQSRLEEAEGMAREAVNIFRNMPEGRKKERLIGSALQGLGAALRHQGRLEESAEAFRAALGHNKKSYGDDSDQVAANLNNLANDLRDLGDPVQAETMFRECIEICHKNGIPDEGLGYTLHNLATALEQEGKLSEAEETWRKQVASFEKLAGGDNEGLQQMNGDVHLISDLGNLERLLRREGKAEQAAEVYRDGQVRLERMADCLARANKPATSDLLRARGLVYAYLGRWREAAADFRHYCESTPDDYRIWETLAAALLRNGDLDGYRRHSLTGYEHFRNTKSPDVADCVAKACLVLPESGVDVEAGGTLADRALALEKSSVRMPWRQFCEALAEYRRGNFPEAARWSEQTLQHASDPLGPKVWAVNNNTVERDACAYALLAMAQHQLGRVREAEVTLAKGKAAEGSLPSIVLNGDLVNGAYAQALLREAKELIEGKTPDGLVRGPASVVQSPTSKVQSRAEVPSGAQPAGGEKQPKSE